MVHFELIAMFNEEGQAMMFSDLDTFDAFRKKLWQEIPQNLHLVLEWVTQNSMERALERRFNVPHRSLDGLCLIFGTRRELAERMSNPETRAILLDPETKVRLRITFSDSKAFSIVNRGDQTYNLTYPLAQTLIPEGTPVTLKYLEFAATRRTEVEGSAMMVF